MLFDAKNGAHNFDPVKTEDVAEELEKFFFYIFGMEREATNPKTIDINSKYSFNEFWLVLNVRISLYPWNKNLNFHFQNEIKQFIIQNNRQHSIFCSNFFYFRLFFRFVYLFSYWTRRHRFALLIPSAIYL